MRRAGSNPVHRTPPARTYLYTLLGEYVVGREEVWTEVLVDALGLLDVKEKAARQAIARLAADGMLSSRREGRRAQLALTERGRRWIEEGRARSIRFHEPADAAIGNWLLLHVPITDDQRDARYHVNRRLVSLGWGSIGSSLWLNSGASSEEAVLLTLRRLGLEEHATMVRAEFRPPTRLPELVARAWDLPSIAARYRQFLADHLDAHRGVAPGDDAAAFALRSKVIGEFTHSLWTDPRLPAELLPADWPGADAMALVRDVYLRQRPAALRWWASRTDASAPRRRAP
jgi:phenylacetic acid degradation operon negative regulatory protein